MESENTRVDRSSQFFKKMGSWPEDVGIVDMELVIPSTFVSQEDLETYDSVSKGKYTVGLGQDKMGFCSDREDINSLCLTAVSRLVKRLGISYKDIGYLSVGTETIIDKSKSVKSVLMQLFRDSDNHDIEGVDTVNACYGGTAALFNTVCWVESSAWDGRYGLAVCGDIAVYAEGSARPTGGAGAIAMLVGPHAPLVFERGLRATHMDHAYDFYKPNLSSEYPVVDGRLSIRCYLSALDQCYQLYCKKARAISGLTGESNHAVGLNSFDAFIFHSPYGKLVQKSLSRILLNDFHTTPRDLVPQLYPGLDKFIGTKLEESYFDRDLEKAFMDFGKEVYVKKTLPTLLLSNQVGNMYTTSLYGGLVSYLISKAVSDLAGQRIALFSYGSGMASSMFSMKLIAGPKLENLVKGLQTVHEALSKRIKVSPEEFSDIMKVRELNHHVAPYTPVGSIDSLFPDTYYLEKVDEMHRRTYGIKS